MGPLAHPGFCSTVLRTGGVCATSSLESASNSMRERGVDRSPGSCRASASACRSDAPTLLAHLMRERCGCERSSPRPGPASGCATPQLNCPLPLRPLLVGLNSCPGDSRGGAAKGSTSQTPPAAFANFEPGGGVPQVGKAEHGSGAPLPAA
eukprot:363453-Chlamydomonas_euryale.AAC.2